MHLAPEMHKCCPAQFSLTEGLSSGSESSLHFGLCSAASGVAIAIFSR